ncbi:MAG: hypothetical protein ACYCQI_16435 [Gammaproteobacteria bacterium]
MQIRSEEKPREIATQTEPGIWVDLKELTTKNLSKEPIQKPLEKPKSKLGLAVDRLFFNCFYRWHGKPVPPEGIAKYNELERLLKEDKPQEQKPAGSSTSISSALAQAEKAKAPQHQDMDATTGTKEKSTRCETVKKYLDDLYFTGYAGGTAVTLVPVLLGYAAYRAQEYGHEKDNELSCVLFCLAMACSAPGGTVGGLLVSGPGLFGVPCVAYANKEPQFVKDTAESAKRLLGMSY